MLSANISPQYVNSRVSSLSIDEPRPFRDPCWVFFKLNFNVGILTLNIELGAMCKLLLIKQETELNE